MQKPAVSDGFSAGLKYWLFFLVVFSLVGYPALLSIFLGAIGALAGGIIVAWDKAKEESSPSSKPPSEVIPEPEPERDAQRRRVNRRRPKPKTRPKPKLRNRRRDARPLGRLFGRRS